MYIAVCDDQTEELKDLTELLGAWETDRGTPVRVKSFAHDLSYKAPRIASRHARAREELPQRGGAAGRGAP